jgi:hypothetical protein
MKFVTTREQRAAIMPRLTERMRADENALEGAYYPIVSVYYDNPDRDCFWEKEQKVPQSPQDAGAYLWKLRRPHAPDRVRRDQAQVRRTRSEAKTSSAPWRKLTGFPLEIRRGSRLSRSI